MTWSCVRTSGLVGIATVAFAAEALSQSMPNTLTDEEGAAGWILLFDGTSLDGWRGYNMQGLPGSWAVEDGTLTRVGPGGDLITEAQYGDFELAFDWRVEAGGNSGVFYRVAEGHEFAYFSGPEYQVLDDAGHADGRNPLTSAGSNYGLYPAASGVVRPAGEWNSGRIVVQGNHVEHWLNGTQVVAYELHSDEWQALVAGSKFAAWPAYGTAERGHIGVQDHGDRVWYRNLKLREIGQDSAPATVPLTIGETFTIESRVLGETRRVNVYLPPQYHAAPDVRLPVLYMPDGGIGEDFLHVAGLVQVSVGNGTMRPFILVGIENTFRRRDLTGPTENPEDRTIAPEVGGSASFRRFLQEELIPQVEARYRTTPESAIVGESLAGLFIIETLVLEPDLFDTYIAFDPSLWWNGGEIVERAPEWVDGLKGRTLYMATSSDGDVDELISRLADVLRAEAPPDASVHYEPMPDERHATIYHPAALRAFRLLFAPEQAR